MDTQTSHPKLVSIEINTRTFEVTHGKITFEAVVALAYPPTPGQPRIACTVTYHYKNEPTDHKLAAGGSVEVVEDMAFVVTPTNES